MSNTIQQVIDGLQISQEIYMIKNRLEYLENERIKPDIKSCVPFSDRLNDWIYNWYDNKIKQGFIKINFVDHDDFDSEDLEGTYERD